jgi:Protein of unknown function (DUF3302)
MRTWVCRTLALLMAVHAGGAMANSGLEDKIADVVVWVVVVIVPIIGITAFWILHVWPERIAEKRDHPQKEAIQTLCLLSLVFGGLLWPLAMLWAFLRTPRIIVTRIGPEAEPLDENAENTPAETSELASLRVQLAIMQQRLDDLSAGRMPPTVG